MACARCSRAAPAWKRSWRPRTTRRSTWSKTMAVFQWQGIDARGKDVKGIRDADNPRLLRALLRREGILATAIEEEQAARTRTRREIDFAQYFQRVSIQDVAVTT